jgi:hypothetical protein
VPLDQIHQLLNKAHRALTAMACAAPLTAHVTMGLRQILRLDRRLQQKNDKLIYHFKKTIK